MKSELPRVIGYGAELTRTRYWQEVQLVALGALISARPTHPEDIDDRYARQLIAAAGLLADVAERVHGPSVSEHLQTEKPFVAAPGVKAGDIDETDEAAVVALCKGQG